MCAKEIKRDEFLYSHMVQEYYVRRLREISKKRFEARRKIRTKKQVLELRTNVRAKLQKCFGPFPERTPLNARTTGKIITKDFYIEKVMYESRPGLIVTANLYIPRKGTAPFPAVLGPCGHSQEGKAENAYQSYAQGLAKKGFVVLGYDPISQGERRQYFQDKGYPYPIGCCGEHNMLGNQMRLLGDFFGMWRLWDGIRSLDYILSRREVDKRYVGVTGNSGGGTLSSYLNAFDDRFTMAAPGCFVTTYLSNLENELPADAEQIPPNMLKEGLDMADFFIAQIPRPVLLLGQKNDFFDERGLRKTYNELKALYRIMGAEDKVRLFIGPTNHGYSIHNREAMYGFFQEMTGGKKDAKETKIHLKKEEALWATPKGKVCSIKGSQYVFEYTAEKARAIIEKRPHLCGEKLKKELKHLLNLPARKTMPLYRILRSTRWYKGKTRFMRSKFAVETEPGIQAILHLLQKKESFYHFPEEKEATIFVPHISSMEDMSRVSLPCTLDGLFAVDVRGIGESKALTCGKGDFFNAYGNDYLYASHGEMFGESYAGRRVHDLLCVLDLFKEHGYKKIHLIGRGLGALTATFAACLHPIVKQVTLINTLLSYEELTQTSVFSWPLSSLVPNILSKLDLPDCYRHLSTKKLAVIKPWDSKMHVRRKKKTIIKTCK